jgi:hypothetical protein
MFVALATVVLSAPVALAASVGGVPAGAGAVLYTFVLCGGALACVRQRIMTRPSLSPA